MKYWILTAALILGTLNLSFAESNFSSDPVESTSPSEASKRRKEKTRLKKFRRSIRKGDDLSKFSYHQKLFVINAPIDSVWKMYTSVSPTEAWSGPLNTFKQAYSHANDSIYLASDSILPAIEQEMVYELNLRVAGMLNVSVAFQITTIDSVQKVIEFTYGKDNASHGRQRIVFRSEGETTYIIHYSNFKSKSKFRDKVLYPKFHELCIDEFHENLRGMIESRAHMFNTPKLIFPNGIDDFIVDLESSPL
jgi:hypothetical protein